MAFLTKYSINRAKHLRNMSNLVEGLKGMSSGNSDWLA